MKQILIVAMLAFASPAMAQQMVGPALNLSPETLAWLKDNSTYRESPPVKTKSTAEIQREADEGWAYYRKLHPSLEHTYSKVQIAINRCYATAPWTIPKGYYKKCIARAKAMR